MFVCLALLLSTAGCGRKKDLERPAGDPEPSTAAVVIDGMTGRTAVRSGHRAKAALDRVNTQRESAMREALP